MASVVPRPAGRWEVRESVLTPAGPRSRTLVGFRVLSSAVLDQATARATRPFDRDGVITAARRVGAPVEEPAADALARHLISDMARGGEPSPGLRRLLSDQLARVGPGPQLDTHDSMSEWVGASLTRRGEALRDLLGLADRLPQPRRSRSRFPGLRAVSPPSG
jgi:hypothetical protein